MDDNSQQRIESDGREDTIVQLYWGFLETWGTQVDSYWTRTNYFAAFEIAAMAGTWVLLGDKDLRLGHWTALLVVLLTGAWIFSNVKSHAYVDYWWDVLRELESSEKWEVKPAYISKYEERRKRQRRLLRLPYSIFTNWLVPCFFLAAWLLLIGFYWNGTCAK